MSAERLTQMRKELRSSKIKASKLKKRCEKNAAQQMQAVRKAQEERMTHRLKNKGIYTEETRKLIRILVKAGCAKESIGDIICAVLACAGITTIGKVSQRTVSRVSLEGFVATQIQLGYEIFEAESMAQLTCFVLLNSNLMFFQRFDS